ncbi:hypothetical protein KW543_02295 [Vibrio fluvialis]|nr:hypothetical protein [Vibrio fluvialis]
MPIIKYEMSFDPMLHFEGVKFFKAAKLLKEQPVHYSNTPYWTLLAFSIELMLKSFSVGRVITTSKKNPCIINEVKLAHVKGHSLTDVFNNLPDTLKDLLSIKFEIHSGMVLQEILEQHSTLFDQARYIYPKNGHMKLPTGISVDESSLYKVGEFLSNIPKHEQRN